MRLIRLTAILLPFVVAGACAPGVRTAPVPSVIRVALVDSVPFATEMHDGHHHRVEVRTAERTDTIPDVLTDTPPIVTPDGQVLGFAWEAMGLRDAFAYDPARRRLRWIRLPDDADRAFTTPAFSPDGRHLAYVAYADSFAQGIVRRSARGPVVVRTHAVQVPGTDTAMNGARWIDAETFEILIDVGEPGWHRFRGTVSAGATSSDTTAQPR